MNDGNEYEGEVDDVREDTKGEFMVEEIMISAIKIL
jgi:hypothetical protein